MYGAIIGDIKENGKTTKCMARVKPNGRMAENTKANMLMIKNTELEHFIGLMEENIMVHGRMESNMAVENISLFLDKKGLDNGSMEKE